MIPSWEEWDNEGFIDQLFVAFGSLYWMDLIIKSGYTGCMSINQDLLISMKNTIQIPSLKILYFFSSFRHNISYAGTFVFRGLLGEETRHLQVKGQGTYDSRQEALVNPWR